MTFNKLSLWMSFHTNPFRNNLGQLRNKVQNMIFADKVTSVLVHHTHLESIQEHGLSLLNSENRFDLIRSFDQQVLWTLLALRINDVLALLFLLGLDWLFELDCVHCCLAEPRFVYHFFSFHSVFFRGIAVWNMLKDLALFLVSHFLILFESVFSSLLIILLVIMNTDKIINCGFNFHLW